MSSSSVVVVAAAAHAGVLQVVVVDFLLPLYFANAGLKMDIGAISSARQGRVLIFVIAIACIGKMLPALLVARLTTKKPWRFCASLAVLMNTRGLVEVRQCHLASRY